MKKKGKNRNITVKSEYVPSLLVKKLNEDILSINSYQYTTKNNFLQCVSIIFHHQVTLGEDINNYVPLGRNYWKSVFGGNYHENVINPLLELNILQSFDFGYRSFPDTSAQPTKGKLIGLVGIRYRVNPDLLDDDFQQIHYIDKRKANNAKDRKLVNGSEHENRTQSLDFRMSINQDEVYLWIENNAERICNEFLNADYVDSLPETLIIPFREYLEDGSYNSKYATVNAAKLIAETKGMELFYFKDSFYIAHADDFLKNRIPTLIYHYKRQVSKISTIAIEEKRSPVTLRLYSDLTNFPSKILPFIHINNKTVVQLDLRTSQFLIFANLLNVYIQYGEEYLLALFKHEQTKDYITKLGRILNEHKKQLPPVGINIHDSFDSKNSSSDVLMFIKDVFFNDFYSVIQRELGLKSRMLAKQVLFKLLFKKTNKKDLLLEKLTVRYPVVMSIIAAFKANGKKQKSMEEQDSNESNFSVFLQCVEAEIFIDCILKELRNDDVPCFTRHDSIVVASGYEEQAEAKAKQVFSQYGFKYNHKSEDLFWDIVDYSELEESPYFQWLLDEDILYEVNHSISSNSS